MANTFHLGAFMRMIASKVVAASLFLGLVFCCIDYGEYAINVGIAWRYQIGEYILCELIEACSLSNSLPKRNSFLWKAT